MVTLGLAASAIALAPSGLLPTADAETLDPQELVCPAGSEEVVFEAGIVPAEGGVGPLCQVVFLESGTFSVPDYLTEVDVVIVGGGGGGGLGGIEDGTVYAGGGGAGGMVAVFTGFEVEGDEEVIVGAGGAGATDPCDPACNNYGAAGGNGEASSFGGYSIEGGYGGNLLLGWGGNSPIGSLPGELDGSISGGGTFSFPATMAMGPDGGTVIYGGAGGGAGAGGAGANAQLTSCTTLVGIGEVCSQDAGDGGPGVLPVGGLFDETYWSYFDFTWSPTVFGTGTRVAEYGAGPGGGGGVAGLYLSDSLSGAPLVTTSTGTGVALDGTGALGGQGSAINAVLTDATNPFTSPYQITADAQAWCIEPTGGNVQSCGATYPPMTFGAGGGGAVGNETLVGPGAAPAHVAADGTQGIVIVLFQISDNDGDGSYTLEDCDDSRPTVYPGATEQLRNGLDDDCTSATPSLTRDDFTCEFPTVDALADPQFQRLDFYNLFGSTSVNAIDFGEDAAEGDSFHYQSITAIGGPQFAEGQVTVRNDNVDVGSPTPHRATVQVVDTTGLQVGDAVVAVRVPDEGRLGRLTTTIVSIDSATEFTVATDRSARLGTVVDIRTGDLVDAVVTVVSVDSQTISDLDEGQDYPIDARAIDIDHASRPGPDGTVENVAGSGPWTATISGLASTDGLEVGDQFIADDSDSDDRSLGSIGADGVYVIDSVDAVNGSITYTATGGITPVAGPVEDVLSWSTLEYRIDFFEAGTVPAPTLETGSLEVGAAGVPVELEGVAVSIADVDGFQYVEYLLPDQFLLDAETRLEILTNDDLDIVPDGWVRAWSALPSRNDPRHIVEARYAKTSSVSIRLGQLNDESAAFGVDFRTSDFPAPIECNVSMSEETETTLTYTGDSGVVLAGTPVTLSSVIDPAECTTPAVTYTLVSADGTETPITDPLDTSTLMSGIYEIVASYAGDGTCLPSEDRAVLVVTSAADTVTGGGFYHVDSELSGSPRVHFGFTVQRSEQFDRRTSVRQVTQRGQLLWINNGEWRLKASMYARWTISGGVVSGDRPVFGSFPCPAGVGATGSNPRCGLIVGSGWLERWNADTLEWDRATDLGDEGWVSFGATVYDGGTVSVCKGKRNCTIVDVADWFGMAMDGITTDDGVPVTSPIEVRKQRNGAIVIRV